MKTTILAVAMVLGMGSVAMAQEVSNEPVAVSVENVAEFQVVEVSELPAVVKSAFEAEFPQAAIKEVLSNGVEFKIVFTTEAGEELTAQYNANGEKVQ